MRRKWEALTVAGLLLVSTAGVAGAGVTLTDPGQFLEPTTLITFETFPDGGVVPYTSATLSDEWKDLGVLITDSSPGDGASAYSSTYFGVLPHSGTRALSSSEGSVAGGFIQYHFVVPGTTVATTVLEAGIWVQNGDGPSVVEFLDGAGASLATMPTTNGDFFAGCRDAAGIGSVKVSDPHFFITDDLEFSSPLAIPAPGALLLAGIGVGLVSRFRRA